MNGPDRAARTLVDSLEYSEQRDALPDNEQINRALRGLYWGIAAGPEQFASPLEEFPELRLAKSDDFHLTTGTLRIWFMIRDDDHIDLLALEYSPAEGGTGDSS